MRAFALAACLTFSAAPTTPQDGLPPADFFSGTYRMFGPVPWGLADMKVRLDARGDRLAVGLCGSEDGGELLLPAASGDEHYIVGRIGAWTLTCDHFHGYENYPFLACYGDGGERLSLWPADDFAAPLECGG